MPHSARFPTRRVAESWLGWPHGESSVSELAAPYRMSLPAVSKHLRVLEDAGLVMRQKDGRVHRCRLAAEPMKDVAEWIGTYRQFWEAQLDSLARYFEDSANENVRTSEQAAGETTSSPDLRRKHHGSSNSRHIRQAGSTPHDRRATRTSL